MGAIHTDSKRIVKNTIFLYMRMLLLMLISLYTSRVTLQVLGVSDYGTYQVVGGIVGLLAFLNAALSNGSSRFITFEMGKGEEGNLNLVFQTTFYAHLVLALIVVVLAETLGIWFFYSRLVIPEERLGAAMFAYQSSIATCLISITQVPYSALVISHEKMGIYAYVSIVEGILKLLIVYLITITSFDKLKVFASLIAIVQVGIALYYRYYCNKQFIESTLKGFHFDRSLLKNILSFSSWSLIGNAAHALNNQGTTIITNLFFGSAVVAARALSISVNTAVMQLVNGFRTAANPQIVKLYSSGNESESRKLMLSTTKYSFFLMLAISIPVIFSCKELLGIWLVKVPEYTVVFTQLILLQNLFFTFDTCFYTGLYACGRVKENALISPMLYFIQFVVVYILFRCGFSPVTLSIAGVATTFTAAYIAKPILLKKLANYDYKTTYGLLILCTIILLLSIPIPYFLNTIFGSSLLQTFVRLLLSFISTSLLVMLIGLSKLERQKMYTLLKNKIHIK